MDNRINLSVARVFSSDGKVLGGAFLVSDRNLLTCAHVVFQALGVSEDQHAVGKQVDIDFPLLEPGLKRKAKLIQFWPSQSPESPSSDGLEDIAVLELQNQAPLKSHPATLIASENIWEHPFSAFGFPAGHSEGVWARGILMRSVANGWVQVGDDRTPGFRIEPGFSGTPVQDEERGGVVGMVVAAERRPEIKAAYIIPADTLNKVWPGIVQVPGAPLPPCPYKGLSAFREQDASLFFGRELLVDRITESVRKRPLVSVVGASGSGKSSVIFGGLVPALRNATGWIIIQMRPADRPFSSLASACVPLLEPEMTEVDRLLESKKLADVFENGNLTLDVILNQALTKTAGTNRLLLILDQFEEVYTQNQNRDQINQFIKQILTIIHPQTAEAKLGVLLSCRADFVGYTLSNRLFADALQDADRILVGPMTREELRSAIEKPAQKLGVKIADGLTERMLTDADVDKSMGSLPLLEFALTLLWDRQENATLTHAAYDAIGGVGNALALYAEKEYENLGKEDRQQARRLLLALVRPGAGTGDTRRIAHRAELGEEKWELVSKLATNRLVVSGRDETSGEETVEIVHEAMIDSWARLQDWLVEDRDFRIWIERLRSAIQSWDAANRDEDGLLRGPTLVTAQNWLQERQPDFNETERQFVEESIRFQARARVAREAARRRLNIITTTAFMIFVILGVAALTEWRQARQNLASGWDRMARGALIEKDIPSAELLFAQALTLNDTANTRYGLIEARARGAIHRLAVRTDYGSAVVGFDDKGGFLVSGKGDKSIGKWTELNGPEVCETLSGSGGQTVVVAFSHDGKWVARGAANGTVWVWNLSDPNRPLRVHGMENLRALAFSPSAGLLAVAGDSGIVEVWDLRASGRAQQIPQPSDSLHPTRLTGPKDAVTSLAFSNDSKRVAAGSRDTKAYVWSLEGNTPPTMLEGHQDVVLAVAFSPNGNFLASGGKDNAIYVWDLRSSEHLQRRVLTGHQSAVTSLSFDPESRLIVSGGEDRTVRVWHIDGEELLVLRGFSQGVTSLAIWGNYVASGGDDGIARVWQINDLGRESFVFLGHEGAVSALAYSRDGQVLASAGEDKTIRIWDTNSRKLLRVLPLEQNREIKDEYRWLAFSPRKSNRILASSSEEGEIRLWDADTGKILRVLPNQASGAVWALAFSPDGAVLASGDPHGTITLWNMDDATKSPQILRESDSNPADLSPIYSLAFSMDGNWLASGDKDGHVLLWNMKELSTHAHIFLGHKGAVWGVAFGLQNELISGGEDGNIRIWNIQNEQSPPRIVTGHVGEIWGVAFSKSGVLASCGNDGTIRLWRMSDGAQQLVLHGREGTLWTLAFDPAGDRLASAGLDWTVRLWDVGMTEKTMKAPPKDLLKNAQMDTDMEVEGLDAVPTFPAKSLAPSK